MKKNHDKSMIDVKNFPRCARQFVKDFQIKWWKINDIFKNFPRCARYLLRVVKNPSFHDFSSEILFKNRMKCTVINWKQYCVAKHFIQPTGIGARKRVTAQIWAVVLLPGDTFTSFTSHVHFINFINFIIEKVIICWFSNQKCKHIFWDSWAKLVSGL